MLFRSLFLCSFAFQVASAIRGPKMRDNDGSNDVGRKDDMSGTNKAVSYSARLSEQDYKTFPQGGGRVKILNSTDITNGTFGFAFLDLFPGGVRELHWHPYSAEWGYVTLGSCRITLMDNDGRYDNSIANKGDIWYFPSNWGHAIQGVDPQHGCSMALTFDAPFSPIFNDLALSEMMTTFPLDVLSENLGTPVDVLETFAQRLLFVNKGPFPPPPFPKSKNPLHESHVFSVAKGECEDSGVGGYALEVRNDIFPATLTMSGGFMRLEEGSMREIHWHPNADELQYVLSGSLKVSMYAVTIHNRNNYTYTISAGDVGFVPRGYAHYLEAVDGPVELLLTFNNPSWQTQELSTWLSVTPTYLTAASVNTTTDIIDKYFPKSTAEYYGDKDDKCPGVRRLSGRRHRRRLDSE